MTQRKHPKSQAKRDVKASVGKNGQASDSADTSSSGPGSGPPSGPPSGTSCFSLVLVLALIGLWSSMAVVYFDVVDYESVLARAKELRLNFTHVLQGRLSAYDTDADGDFDLDDAKVLLGLKMREKTVTPPAEEKTESGADHSFVPDHVGGDSFFSHASEQEQKQKLETPIDSTGVLVQEPQETVLESEQFVTSSKVPSDSESAADEQTRSEKPSDEQTRSEKPSDEQTRSEKRSDPVEAEDSFVAHTEKLPNKDKEKKEKPKLWNAFDKSIKSEIDTAEKLRKKGQLQGALQAFEALVQRYPHSPRARYGRAQCEDDMAEKRRSNDLLQKAINSYGELWELPDVTPDLLKVALKRRAERQQFLGRIRGSLSTLQRLVQTFPEDYSLKNDLGISHLLLGDNKAAKVVYGEVLAVAPDDGFAKVHYGFILKSENQIAESIPYLRGGLESGQPGTDDGRFYFHLGDALQRVGQREEAHRWYESGHQRGHFPSVWQRSLYNVNGLRAQAWWRAEETGYTELVQTLERHWKIIRDEALKVMDLKSGLFLPEDENLRETGDWGQYTLWQQGRRAGPACENVPQTCALLEKFPEATRCKRGQIKFSVMRPGTHVWPHTGPTNCRLRMHLGLVVPESGCRIRVTNDERTWQEGKVLIFDDSFEHEVWQDAESQRLIFIVDVWHPELTPLQRQTLSPI
uniref:Un-named hu7910 n=1 Tax=Knipowitschia caucasica TaxID=637954 RepID=A0AAV2L302_KNICA